MISKFKYLNFQYDLEKIKKFLPNIDYKPSDLKVEDLPIKQNLIIQHVIKSRYIVSKVLYFKILGGSIGNIHIDTDISNSTIDNHIALNIPILNGDIAVMRWYKQKENTKMHCMIGPSKTVNIPMLTYNDAICVAESNISKPIIVKVDDWHSISNISETEPCEILSIRFLNK